MFVKIIVLIATSIVLFMNNISCLLIISYQRNKPLGLQTLLDRLIIKLFIISMIFTYIYSFLLFSLYFIIPFPAFIAQFLFYFQSFSFDYYLTWYFAVICIQFLSISFPSLIELNITDCEFVKKLNFIIIMLLVFLMGLESTFSTVHEFKIYMVLSGNILDSEPKKMTKVALYLQILDIFAAIFIFCVIKKKSAFQNGNNHQSLENHHHLIRLITFLVCTFLLFTLYTMTTFDVNNASGTKAVVIVFAYGVIPPLLYINRSNEQLKLYAYNRICTLFSSSE